MDILLNFSKYNASARQVFSPHVTAINNDLVYNLLFYTTQQLPI